MRGGERRSARRDCNLPPSRPRALRLSRSPHKKTTIDEPLPCIANLVFRLDNHRGFDRQVRHRRHAEGFVLGSRHRHNSDMAAVPRRACSELDGARTSQMSLWPLEERRLRIPRLQPRAANAL